MPRAAGRNINQIRTLARGVAECQQMIDIAAAIPTGFLEIVSDYFQYFAGASICFYWR
jgi:hypothetical protein